MSGEKGSPESEQATESPVQPDAADSETVQSEAIESEAEQLLAEMENETVSAEQLVKQLEEVSNKANENWDKLLRTQAEMENLRRRTEKELQNAHKFALENFAKELLPVIDSLELGVQAAIGDSPEITKLREGNELILKQLGTVLDKFNISVVDPGGAAFNPDLHQAISIQQTDEAEPNTVVQVFQKGYLLNERLLRPAMVVVAQAETKPTKTDQHA